MTKDQVMNNFLNHITINWYGYADSVGTEFIFIDNRMHLFFYKHKHREKWAHSHSFKAWVKDHLDCHEEEFKIWVENNDELLNKVYDEGTNISQLC